VSVRGLLFPTDRPDETCFTDAADIPTRGEVVFSSLLWTSIMKGSFPMANKKFLSVAILSSKHTIYFTPEDCCGVG